MVQCLRPGKVDDPPTPKAPGWGVDFRQYDCDMLSEVFAVFLLMTPRDCLKVTLLSDNHRSGLSQLQMKLCYKPQIAPGYIHILSGPATSFSGQVKSVDFVLLLAYNWQRTRGPENSSSTSGTS